MLFKSAIYPWECIKLHLITKDHFLFHVLDERMHNPAASSGVFSLSVDQISASGGVSNPPLRNEQSKLHNKKPPVDFSAGGL
jgi:hypothetical protein